MNLLLTLKMIDFGGFPEFNIIFRFQGVEKEFNVFSIPDFDISLAIFRFI